VIVFRPLYKVPVVHWSRHLAMDGSALADPRRKSTLTDRKEVQSLPLKIVHVELNLNRRLYSCTIVVESKCEEAGSGAYPPQDPNKKALLRNASLATIAKLKFDNGVGDEVMVRRYSTG
jgi:hypothetical protein